MDVDLEESIAEDREPAIGLAAATRPIVRYRLRVMPEFPAAFQVQRPGVVRWTGHVHHAIPNEGCRLELPADAGLEHPRGHESMHVSRIDLVQRRVAPSRVVPAVHQPRFVILLGREESRLVDLRRGCQRPKEQGAEDSDACHGFEPSPRRLCMYATRSRCCASVKVSE